MEYNNNFNQNSNGYNENSDYVPPIDFGDFEPNFEQSKKIFSKVHLALFIYLAVCYGSLFIIEIALSVILGDKMLTLVENPIFSLGLSSVCQYLIAFPVFLILTRKKNGFKAPIKTKMKLSTLAAAFLACQALMIIGNIIGIFINSLVEGFTGVSPENSIDTLVSSTPVWLLILVVVIVGPIVEEIMLRKVFIDRLSCFGDFNAIIFSSVAFGLIHGNLYQFFYAFLIGLVLGYVYTSTRNVKYTVILHMILNFLGSIVSIYVMQASENLTEIFESLSNGLAVDNLKFAIALLVTELYTFIQYTLFFGAGICVLVLFFKSGGIRQISRNGQIYLPKNKVFSVGVLNTGTILFYISCLLLFLLNLIPIA